MWPAVDVQSALHCNVDGPALIWPVRNIGQWRISAIWGPLHLLSFACHPSQGLEMNGHNIDTACVGSHASPDQKVKSTLLSRGQY